MTKLSITLRLGRRRSKTQESSTTDSRNSADSDGGQGRPRGATSVVSSSSGAGSEIQTRARSGTGLSFNEDDSGEVDSVRAKAFFISLLNVICLVVTFRGRSYLKVIIAVVCMYSVYVHVMFLLCAVDAKILVISFRNYLYLCSCLSANESLPTSNCVKCLFFYCWPLVNPATRFLLRLSIIPNSLYSWWDRGTFAIQNLAPTRART